ncbi:hypothetical protein RBS60_04230 [Sinomonas sp. ASV486]|uniref:hypothetical protein n=1 Tax=Sinomonas sp. ASV486 TaxID=3051170 RepID=UPI0027DE0FC1|nr:hypothetical protein [Sinomonas sp. ASV486]MDQ4489405.1 hypothetical protein [Sinomonas sp. ASV486]
MSARFLVRALAVLSGAAMVGVGGVLLLGSLALGQLVGLAVWLAAAVVVHDGVWVPTVTAAAKVGPRVWSRIWRALHGASRPS